MKTMVTNELLAAYAEGNVTPEEREAVRQYLVEHPEQVECLLYAIEDGVEVCDTCNNTVFMDNLASMLNDVEAEVPFPLTSDLPMAAKVAQNMVDNRCAVYCEGLALRHFGVDVDDETLLREALGRGWLRSEGTALCDVGRLAGIYGLSVSHRYYCKIEEVCQMMGPDRVVIAAVDGNELSGDYMVEQGKDKEMGPTPNHVVILVGIDEETVTLIDPAMPQQQQRSYSLSQFVDAWADSANSLVVISNSDEYVPHPIDLSDVKVEEELIELREAIAENAHEVWAEERRKEGWSYGPVRDDERKFHPDMLPYNRLPESEKEYDRLMALNTIKLVKKLGWELKKKK